MREYLTEVDTEGTIRALLKHPLYKDKKILIVEGESDRRLFCKLLENLPLKCELAGSKSSVIKIMKDLVNVFPQKLLGICDADFEHLDNQAIVHEQYSVFTTDQHDLEMMMLHSGALSSLFYTLVHNEMVEDIKNNFGEILEAAYTIGILRLVNYQNNLNLRFKGLDYSLFIDVKKLDIKINLHLLIEQLLKKSSQLEDYITREYLQQKISETLAKGHPQMQVCCGHDVTKILALILRQPSISKNDKINKDKVEDILTAGYTKYDFQKTKLYDRVFKCLA